MIKLTILLVRNPSLTHERFVSHHREAHAPLFLSVPAARDTVLRYVQQHTLPVNLPGAPETRFDGITELWFDSADAMERLFSDPVYLERVRPDEASFLDIGRCELIVTEGTEIHAR